MEARASQRALAGLAVVLLMVLPAGFPGEPAEALAPPVPLPLPTVRLAPVASGFTLPVLATHAGDGTGRLFVVEQTGAIKVLQGGVASPWLSLAGKVACCGERGLLGLAFHPDFEANGVFVVSYTRAGDGASVLERFVVQNPPLGAPPASGQVILVQPQPYANHNGGHVAFGPDGYLYLGLGDGGSGGDPQNFAQNPQSLLGKMLRLDVDGPTGYAIPPTNPFALAPGLARPEIWALGLRNPWRWSFDRVTGDLWVADVGQGNWEEVNLQPAGWPGAANYGWRCFEGAHPYAPCGAPLGVLVMPSVEYSHAFGCSVTGGYVYRGLAMPLLHGAYLYGDFCSGRIWAAVGAGPARTALQLLDTSHLVSSFGEDEAGEVYVVTYLGSVLRVEPA